MNTHELIFRQQAVFVAGTDTGVGKTEVALLLMRRFQQQGFVVNGMKPFATGAKRTAEGLRNEDAEQLRLAGTLGLSYEEVNPWVFEPAIAPHLAAQEIGLTFDWSSVLQRVHKLKQRSDLLVIEGIGGWCVPLDAKYSTEDFVIWLKVPVILVVGLRLGCLNHALLTYRAIVRSGLDCVGWVANQIDPTMACIPENIAALEQRIGAPLLGRIPFCTNGVGGAIDLHLDIDCF